MKEEKKRGRKRKSEVEEDEELIREEYPLSCFPHFCCFVLMWLFLLSETKKTIPFLI
jgi:hypothetical protein